ncbi:aminotransferase class V-fold PLP-dependent enzyme [Streptomyces venezuelae]|uniref:aminotransferase class V-fold PLP-dependent enzyme n=1 Tax=Streptomyces venezuelae TaxID=54571 RepID=UPI0021E09E9A|nr:aminotransferase class V-fold PLP-dependent enzyme [Streptomyces venezuelae]
MLGSRCCPWTARVSWSRPTSRRRSATTRSSYRSWPPNNETGALQPVAELAALAHARGAHFHCDAAQAGRGRAVRTRRCAAGAGRLRRRAGVRPACGVRVAALRDGWLSAPASGATVPRPHRRVRCWG